MAGVGFEVAPHQLDDFLANIASSCQRGLPQFEPTWEARKGTLVIVGGSPSVKDYEATIRRLRQHPRNRVFALNSAVDWLAERKIRADGCVMMEIAPWPAAMNLRPHPCTTYYLASFAAGDTYDRLNGQVVQWHGMAPGMEIVREHIADPFFLHPMGNAGPTSLVIGLWLGFRRFEVFGMDCSFSEQSHAYEHCDEETYQAGKNLLELETPYGVEEFHTTHVLHQQAREVIQFCQANRGRFRMRVHGDGLLPCAHRLYFPEEY